MGKREIDDFRVALLRERQALLDTKDAAGDAARPVQLDQSSVGRLSRMDAMQMQHMALESERRREAKLQRIDGALRRIDDQRFGDCFVCGEEIDRARLKLDPTVTRCLDCLEE